MWTTFEDIVSRWLGDDVPTAADEAKILVLIDDIEDEITRVVPSVPKRILDGELPVVRVKRVVASVLQRALKISGNPLSSWSETVGPFSQSGSLPQGVSRAISLNTSEIDTLKPKTPGAYMVNFAQRQGRSYQTYSPNLRLERGEPYDFYTNVEPGHSWY